MKAILYTISLLMLSCGSTNVAQETSSANDTRTTESKSAEQMQQKQEMKHEILVQDAYGGPVEPQIMVIKEPKGLQKIYTQINMTRRPGFPVPNIDFSKETVVAICMGEKNTGGFSVDVAGIRETKEGVTVMVKEIGPAAGDMVTMAISQPFCIIKIPVAKKEITFEKVK